jgi:hypothetical protein
VKGKCHVIISGIVIAHVWKDIKKITATISFKAIVIHDCQALASWKEMQFKFCTNFYMAVKCEHKRVKQLSKSKQQKWNS